MEWQDPNKEQMARKQTKTAILSKLSDNNRTDKYLLDQVDEYMEYYDSLKAINLKLSKGFDVNLSKEKRMITKEMRSILMFLELNPAALEEVDVIEEL